MKCRACFGTNLTDFVDLGLQPPSNHYLDTVQAQHVYPLKMLVCQDCGLGQLSETVAPESIFHDYMYFSSQSPTWVADRKALADRMINEFQPNLVVDIGSNDGYYLKHFFGHCEVLGFEPAANVAKVAVDAGIPTLVDFWGRGGVDGWPDLINATNVLAHTPNMDGMIEGIAKSLAPDGVATLEFPLFSNLIRHNQLDTIYHEHYSYISVGALQRVLTRHQLRIWRIEELATHGGSVRVFACKESARFRKEESVARVANKELFAPDRSFQERAEAVRWGLLSFLAKVRDQGLVVGYGAPAKATVLANYVGIDAGSVAYTVDDSPYKQGKFIPGTNIPIISFDEHCRNLSPDYILLFAWNLREPISKKLRGAYPRQPGGPRPKLITAIPELTVTEI